MNGFHRRYLWGTVTLLAILGLAAGLLGAFTGGAQSGSSLLVQAVASTRGVLARSADAVSVYATVQSSAGLIDGLSAPNFTVFAEQVPSQGCRVEVVQVRNGRPGVYRLDLVPARDVPNCTWRLGDYVLSVSVRQGAQSGAAPVLLRFE
jgi:hypothetical protein